MGRKRKGLPDYCCISAFSNFAILPVDLLKSEQFRELSEHARYLYIICMANAKDGTARKSLERHITEDNRRSGKEIYEGMAEYMTGEYFVLPAKQAASYGIDRKRSWYYMNQLIQAGFVEIVEANKHRQKENVYKFSTKWKRKGQGG